MLMPVGKYRGKQLNQIPLDYLQWAIRVFKDRDLAEQLNNEQQNRYFNNRKKNGKRSCSRLV
jgi:hypothetical protein